MDVSVNLGQTKSAEGIKLISQSFVSALGEQVILLLQLHATPQEAKMIEKECSLIVKHSLLETEGEASTRLDGVLKELNGLFKGFIVAGKISDIHAVLGIIDSDNTLHISHAGRAEAYVIRGGAASQITEYTRGKPTTAFVHIASGALETRDVLILSTQRLLRTFTPAQLAQLAQRGDHLLDDLKLSLEGEKEVASIATLDIEGVSITSKTSKVKPIGKTKSRRSRKKKSSSFALPSINSEAILEGVGSAFTKTKEALTEVNAVQTMKEKGGVLISDLRDPKRKRRAHLLLLAGILVVFLGIWAVVNMSAYSERSKTRTELEQIIEEIEKDIQTAENRYLTGEVDSANAILLRAEERAKQVMDNENKLFRTEAHDLLGRIRTKEEEMNNVIRLSPRMVVNLAAKTSDIISIGLIGIGDGEFVVHDHQDSYRILLNSTEEPQRISDDELLTQGAYFDRYKTLVFQTNGNSLIELVNGQPINMKTEDASGWITGSSIWAYLRYLYVLSPENNQIYKYERFSNRYSAPSEYNVNADLRDALDMAIDGNIYVLKKGGEVIKLFRGEVKPFVVRQMPTDAIKSATKIFKAFDGHLYFLDPMNSRVVVTTDGGDSGEASYIRQYILEGEIGELQDLYVDEDETRLYVLDEKQLYVIDLK